MKCFLTVLFYCIYSSVSQAQQYHLADFKKSQPAKYPSNEYIELNNAPISFKVSFKNNRLTIHKDQMQGSSNLLIGDGELIGYDNGEWGGALVYKSANLKVDTLKSGNIKGIFKLNNQIYFLEGLAHGSFNAGSLYKLKRRNSRFLYVKVLDFKDAPEAYAVYKNQLFVAGHSNFYIVKSDKSTMVFEDMFWESLYPNSIAVVDDSKVYMGIRSGFVKLNIIDGKFDFYKYAKPKK